MIASKTVYEACLALAKKDTRGNAFNLEEYNRVAPIVNMELFNFYMSKHETDFVISQRMAIFKMRNESITLTNGVGLLPSPVIFNSGAYELDLTDLSSYHNRMIGNLTYQYPMGIITATEEVEVVNDPDTKVKITSLNHGLKDGAIVTVTGLSVHVITAEPIHFIDKNSFWVDVDWVADDVLTSPRWVVSNSDYKEIDWVTERELDARLTDSLTKPTIMNPCAVISRARDYRRLRITGIYNAAGLGYPGSVTVICATPHKFKTGDYVYINGTTSYNGGYSISSYTQAVAGITSDYAFRITAVYVASEEGECYPSTSGIEINVYPTTIPTVRTSYYRLPAIPMLDYYVDSNYTMHWLDSGAYNVAIADGDEYRDGTLGPANIDSSTTNWEWDTSMLPEIVYMVLQKMGINLENMGVTQIATQLQAKEESKIV